ncbi:MAG: cupin domain-containing protein [Candidatus Kapaibacteriota bacterium]
MSQIKIKKLTDEEINEKGIWNWPIWEKEISTFDWYYDETEQCYFLEGKVIVKTSSGNYEIGKGDFVTFPAGLSCVWQVVEPVRKHYRFI